MKKPESNVAAMIIRILLSRSSFRDSKVSLFSIMCFSTAVREFPISRGANNENIREIIAVSYTHLTLPTKA